MRPRRRCRFPGTDGSSFRRSPRSPSGSSPTARRQSGSPATCQQPLPRTRTEHVSLSSLPRVGGLPRQCRYGCASAAYQAQRWLMSPHKRRRRAGFSGRQSSVAMPLCRLGARALAGGFSGRTRRVLGRTGWRLCRQYSPDPRPPQHEFGAARQPAYSDAPFLWVRRA